MAAKASTRRPSKPQPGATDAEFVAYYEALGCEVAREGDSKPGYANVLGYFISGRTARPERFSPGGSNIRDRSKPGASPYSLDALRRLEVGALVYLIGDAKQVLEAKQRDLDEAQAREIAEVKARYESERELIERMLLDSALEGTPGEKRSRAKH